MVQHNVVPLTIAVQVFELVTGIRAKVRRACAKFFLFIVRINIKRLYENCFLCAIKVLFDILLYNTYTHGFDAILQKHVLQLYFILLPYKCRYRHTFIRCIYTY